MSFTPDPPAGDDLGRPRLAVADRAELHALVVKAFPAPPMPSSERGPWYTTLLRERLGPAIGVDVEHWSEIGTDDGAALIELCEAVIDGFVKLEGIG